MQKIRIPSNLNNTLQAIGINPYRQPVKIERHASRPKRTHRPTTMSFLGRDGETIMYITPVEANNPDDRGTKGTFVDLCPYTGEEMLMP